MYQIEGESAVINEALKQFQLMTLDMLYAQVLMATKEGPDGLPGDPNVGKIIEGVDWDSATETQKQFMVTPAASESKAKANVGPAEPWNRSLVDWGLRPGTPTANAAKVVSGLNTVTGVRESVVIG